MKILFYLPVVTPWWFSEHIAPMIRAVHGDAEVHVMVAPLWRGTGIEAEHLAPLADLDGIHWHIVEDEQPERFRTDGAAIPGLIELVNEIDADLTLARSADLETPTLFPGMVRYIMEGELPPFDVQKMRVLIEERPFRFGVMPDANDPIVARCVDAFADIWANSDRLRHPVLRADWRHLFGLPVSRPILAVPLHYEHEENYFDRHSRFPRAVDLIDHLLRTLDKEVFLAISDHPLNLRYVDRSDLNEMLKGHSERLALCRQSGIPVSATTVLALNADAMFIDRSKTWMLAAHAGTPMVRLGDWNIADWLNVTELPGAPGRNWSPRHLRAADADATQRYFSWHLGTRVFDPNQLTLERLLAHATGQVSDAIIESNARTIESRIRQAA